VALIVSRYDLGSVPFLFREPRVYAKFLATEDRFVWQDELLVVTPSGYGLYRLHDLPKGDEAAIARLPPIASGGGPPLVAAAEQAVRVLAARRGIDLHATTGSGGSSRDVIAGAVVCVALTVLGAGLAVRRRRARAGTISP
jgi:hypothetical protein